jgi:predicted membrane protein
MEGGREGWCRRITITLGALGAWFAFFGKESTKQMLFISALLSGIWVYWYGYDYRSPDQIRVDTFNVTTWVCWTLGLMAAAFFYQAIKSHTKLSVLQRFALTAVLWTVSIMIIEWIGYNKMKIKLKSNYPGLFGLELMHGPWFLKVYYLTVWILFLSLLGVW